MIVTQPPPKSHKDRTRKDSVLLRDAAINTLKRELADVPEDDIRAIVEMLSAPWGDYGFARKDGDPLTASEKQAINSPVTRVWAWLMRNKRAVDMGEMDD